VKTCGTWGPLPSLADYGKKPSGALPAITIAAMRVRASRAFSATRCRDALWRNCFTFLTSFPSVLRSLGNTNARIIGDEFLPDSYQDWGMGQIKNGGLPSQQAPVQVGLSSKIDSTSGRLSIYIRLYNFSIRAEGIECISAATVSRYLLYVRKAEALSPTTKRHSII